MPMLRKFIRNSAIYSGSRFATQGISIFLVPFYTRVFTPGDYGVIDLLYIFTSIVTLVLPLQVTQAVARFYSDTEDPSESRTIASSALYFTVAVLLLFVLVAETIPVEISTALLGDAQYAFLIRVVGISIFFSGTFYFTQNQLKWMQKPVENSVAAILFSLVTIGLSVLFVLILDYGVLGVLLGQIGGGLLGTLLGLYYSRASYHLRFDFKCLKSMLHFSLPLVPASFFILGITIISRLLIKNLMTLDDLGLFAIGFRVASIATIIMIGVRSSLTPMIYASYRNTETPEQIERAFRAILLLAMSVTTAVSLFGREILIVLTTPDYYPASQVIPYLVAAGFLVNLLVFVPGLRIQKETRFLLWIHFAAFIFALGANILLISLFGIVGAAVATLLTSTCLFVVIAWYSQRRYYIPYQWISYLLPAGLSAVAIAGGLSLQYDGWVILVTSKILICVTAMGAIFTCLTTRQERSGYIRMLKRRFPASG
jgi:O-antigen/teichoic acid export membrane protein